MGIGGSGASAIASIAHAQGYEVSGCDRIVHNQFTKNLPPERLFEGHSIDHLNDIDILAISPAISSLDPNNPEFKQAKERGIEVLTWQEFMGKYLEDGKFVIAICGTHGKSTTTAMIACVLEDANLDPTVELGAVVAKWDSNFRVGKSKYFVSEADEFNNNFLVSHPDITVVTNIEMDHPEFFRDFEDYVDSYDRFLMQNKGTIVANLEDKNIAELLKWVMKNSSSVCLDCTRHEINLDLKVIGQHNRKNALAAFQVGLLLGIEPQKIIQSLNLFTGIGRRQEYLGEVNGAKIYSDYAHHPTEVKVTAQAFRETFPNKNIKIVFQPHMYTRTKYLFDDFVKAFAEIPVDQSIIVDIFAAREKDPGDVSSQKLVEAINNESVEYIPTTDESIKKIEPNLSDQDVVIFMGAASLNDELARKWVKG